MIQRIQSLYLLISAILLSTMLFFPLAEVQTVSYSDQVTIQASAEGVAVAQTVVTELHSAWVTILISIAAAITLVTIFMYKNRLLQIRMCYMLYVLLLGAVGFIVYMIFVAGKELIGEGVVSYSLTDIFPLISLILTYLACRGIIKDEATIRSLNRVR